MTTPTHTRLPVLLCIRLYFGPCRVERGQRFQVRADPDQRRERREVGLHAARVEHLRPEIAIGERDRIAEAVATRCTELASLLLQSAKSLGRPVAIPRSH